MGHGGGKKKRSQEIYPNETQRDGGAIVRWSDACQIRRNGTMGSISDMYGEINDYVYSWLMGYNVLDVFNAGGCIP